MKSYSAQDEREAVAELPQVGSIFSAFGTKLSRLCLSSGGTGHGFASPPSFRRAPGTRKPGFLEPGFSSCRPSQTLTEAAARDLLP